MNNLYFGIDFREQLAKEIRFPESRAKYGFIIEDLDSMSREKRNPKSLLKRNETRNMISDRREFEVQKLQQGHRSH